MFVCRPVPLWKNTLPFIDTWRLFREEEQVYLIHEGTQSRRGPLLMLLYASSQRSAKVEHIKMKYCNCSWNETGNIFWKLFRSLRCEDMFVSCRSPLLGRNVVNDPPVTNIKKIPGLHTHTQAHDRPPVCFCVTEPEHVQTCWMCCKLESLLFVGRRWRGWHGWQVSKCWPLKRPFTLH